MKIVTKNYTLNKMTIKMVNKNYLKWFSDEKIIRYIDNTPKNLSALKAYVININKDSNTFFWAIVPSS